MQQPLRILFTSAILQAKASSSDLHTIKWAILSQLAGPIVAYCVVVAVSSVSNNLVRFTSLALSVKVAY